MRNLVSRMGVAFVVCFILVMTGALFELVLPRQRRQ